MPSRDIFNIWCQHIFADLLSAERKVAELVPDIPLSTHSLVLDRILRRAQVLEIDDLRNAERQKVKKKHDQDTGQETSKPARNLVLASHVEALYRLCEQVIVFQPGHQAAESNLSGCFSLIRTLAL